MEQIPQPPQYGPQPVTPQPIPPVTPGNSPVRAVAATLIAAAILGGAYLVLAYNQLMWPFSSHMAPEQQIPATNPPAETAANPATTQSPKEVYMKMRMEMDGITNYAQFEAIMLKYGSKAQVALLEANRAKIASLSAAFKDSLAIAAKQPPSSELIVVEQTNNGTSAVLKVSSSKSDFRGTVNVILEDSQWKIDKIELEPQKLQ